jgi:hypothetical protein
MLGIESQYRLKDFLRALALKELQIEDQRQRLARHEEFEPYAAFCRVNRRGDKRICAAEIVDFMR